MPKANIDSAIKRTFGKDAENYDEINYEGKGPHGVLVFVECATDNHVRTVANVKSYLINQEVAWYLRDHLSLCFRGKRYLSLPCRITWILKNWS